MRLADAPTWRLTATSCVKHVVESYGRGEIDMTGAIAAMHRASIGCWVQDRVRLIGLTGLMALRRVPTKKARGQRTPKWPLWIQNATAALVLHAQNLNPQLRRSPLPAYDPADAATAEGDGTSPLIAWSLEILVSIGWFHDVGPPKPRTVDEWVRAWLRNGGSDEVP